MRSLWRASLVAGLAAITLALLAPANANGQKPKSVSFKTADGVTLQGALYSAGGKKTKDGAVVMLLHDFDHKKGGGSSQDEWGALAKTLQEEGYHVLSFDFRGFGDSKEVSKAFWTHKHNSAGITHNPNKQPETVDHKDFRSTYYAYLVNDIAAAKAFLDRENDRKGVNSSNLLIVGAGQGATLGAMWVANETYRRRDKNKEPQIQPNLSDEPEAKDLTGCVWLTISPRIEGRNVGTTLKNPWLVTAGRTNKIPMAFYYGKADKVGGDYANDLVKTIKGTSKGTDLNVAAVPVDGSKLTGSKLLDSATNKKIIGHLNSMVSVRGNVEMLDKKVEGQSYYYLMPTTKKWTLNKKAGEEVPPVNLSMLGLSP